MRALSVGLAGPFLALLLLCSCSRTEAPVGPGYALQLHGFLESLEIAPLLLAVENYPGQAEGRGILLKRGGIANLVGGITTGYGDPGAADVATNAETQLLRHSLAHPELRVIMTITEGQYRIVARRSAGIRQLADLKGKRVGTMPNTSAAWFLERMLATVNLTPDDVITVGDIDLPQLSDALVDGRIDAMTMWSPEPEEAELGLRDDAIAFSGEGVYREIFNVNTTTQVLTDPGKRAALKELVRALVAARDAMARDPRPAQELVARRMSDYPAALVEASWPHHRHPPGKVPDLLDVMVEQEQWLARLEQRQPREREVLAQLIDYSLLDEVMSEAAR